MMVSGIGLVAGHFQNPFTIVFERAQGKFVNIDGWFYAYMGGILVMWAFGAWVQYRHRKANKDEVKDPFNRLK